MLGYLDFLLLSFHGRIGRTAYWLGSLGLAVLQFAAIFGVMKLAGGTLEQVTADPETMSEAVLIHVMMPVAIVMLIALYPQFALMTKRWHDRGKSGWWWLITLVPVIGGIWAFVELGCLGGDEGDNDFGPNPAYA